MCTRKGDVMGRSRRKRREERRAAGIPPKKLHPNSLKNLAPAWKKGQSGNPKGKPRALILSDAYRHRLEDTFPGSNHTWAEEIAERMAKMALRQVTAAIELADRTEGKAPQALRVTGDVLLPAPTFIVQFTDQPVIHTDQSTQPELKGDSNDNEQHKEVPSALPGQTE
jgi:hypothetical protein